MNKLLIALALALPLALAAAPADAQSGRSPPSPNAASATAEPATSAPPGSLTVNPGSVKDPLTTGALGGPARPGDNGTAGSPSAPFQNTVPAPVAK